ncbi:hypothetical protein G9A89_009763 [Geosiphon pyriformis]|nr:hypothetical protein G9A89_009763 [Geosiphon pyriformis]
MSQVKVGDKIPNDIYFGRFEEGDSEPRKITAEEVFKGKKVVLFGIPGAFTSVCSSKHLPQFVEKYDELRSKGVDLIACVAVNDPYVMREWGKEHNVDNKVLMLADGDLTFHSKLGLSQHLPFSGTRGLRFSMLIEDGVIRVLNVEQPGPTSYKISGPETMLKNLNEISKSG